MDANTNSQLLHYIDDLEQFGEDITEDELTFLDEVSNQLSNDTSLTDEQETRLINIYESRVILCT